MLIPLAVPVAALLILVIAWGVDTALNSGRVARNVSVAGVDVGGLDRAELETELSTLAERYSRTEVIILTADGEVRTTAGDVGLELDPMTTADQVMEIGRGSAWSRPFAWFAGLFGERTSEATVRLADDAEAALARLGELVNRNQSDPIEPELDVIDGVVTVIPGTAVSRFDVSSIRDDLVEAAQRGTVPIEVEAGSLQLNPTISDADAQAFADQMNAMTEDGFAVTAGGETRDFSAAEVRSWLVLTREDRVFGFHLDQERVAQALRERFQEVVIADATTEVTVIDGEVRLDGYVARACCTPDSHERIEAALVAGDNQARLQLERVNTGEQELLREIGIVELVAEATTPHDCCQSRVVNIQLFADLVRGVIIEPGETLSLNEHVGPRTREKGFVESGVIYRGRLQTDVGGGISQFATTIFQAMFYAGIDIDEYQAHTLWFSRYEDFEGRRGIESTISFPKPDVVFTNNTPYPLLIWPTYTDTSLTVSLYSTRHADVEVAGQDIYSSGQCTVIDTERLRRYPDGTTETDMFRALYQPADGIGCDGKPTDPDAVQPSEPDPDPTPEPDPERTPRRRRNRDPEPTPEPAPEPSPAPDPSPEPSPAPEPSPTPPPGGGGGGGGGDGSSDSGIDGGGG